MISRRILAKNHLTIPATLIVFAVSFFAVAATASAATPAEGNQTQTTGSSFLSIACLSSTSCFAAGSDTNDNGQVAESDGNGIWSEDTLPSDTYGLDGIACAAPSSCYAVGRDADEGGEIVTTANGGTMWTTESAPPNVPQLNLIACPSASTCVALSAPTQSGDAYIIGTNDGGSDWQIQDELSGSGNHTVELDGVACSSISVCVVSVSVESFVGDQPSYKDKIYRTTDGGIVWTADSAVPGSDNGLGEVACPSLKSCLVTNDGGDVFISSNGGETWKVKPLPAQTTADSISCATRKVCYTGGLSVVAKTTNGGTSWTGEKLPGRLFTIACPSTLICYASRAANDHVLATTDGGTSWETQAVPST